MGRKKPRPQPVPAGIIPGLVDAHTHLSSCRATTRDEVLAIVARAQAAGVRRLCTVGDTLSECEQAQQAAQYHPDVYAAVAIHPTHAADLDAATKKRLTELAHDDKVVAVGETGLDTYWLNRSEDCADLDTQIEALRWHIDLAVDTNKTLMIHNREADAHLFEVLDQAPHPREIMLHCFSSSLEVAKHAIERGYVLSFAGNVTFKANEELRAAAAACPPEQILIETDAPFMTPEPFRGGRNEPAIIGHTAAVVAAARGEDLADFVAQVGRNFDRVFGL